MSVFRGAAATLALVLLLPAGVLAQGRLTIAAGMAHTEITNFEDSRNGLYVAISTEFPLFGPVEFIPGGHYMERGFTTANTDTKLPFFELRAPLQVAFDVAGPVGVHLFAGPGFALSMGCVFKQFEENVERTVDCSVSDFEFRSWDVTGVAGAGLSFAVTPDVSLVLDGAFDTSLIEASTAPGESGFKHRTLLFSLGVNYPLTRQ